MSDYPPVSYGMGYGAHDQSNSSYIPPTYPAQYMPQNDGRMAQGNMPASYDAPMSSYGYNGPTPSFSATAIASGVPPLPIYQGWNQDAVPMPLYQPANGPAYNPYPENTHPNPPYYTPSNQHAYQQNTLITKPFDEGEVSEGEFEPAAASIPPTSYASDQYRPNDRGEYSESSRRTISYTGAPSQVPQQQYNPVNNYNAPARNPARDSPQLRREQLDTYSPYNSPRPVETTSSKSASNPYTQSQSQGSKPGAPRDHHSSAQNGTKGYQEPSSYSNGRGTPAREDYSANRASSLKPPSVQKSLINSRSVETIRNEAGKAVLQLSPLVDYVQFQDFLDEGIRENVLTGLYSHLKLPIQTSVKLGSIVKGRDGHALTTLELSESPLPPRSNGLVGEQSRFFQVAGEQSGVNGISPPSQLNGKQTAPIVTDLTKSSTTTARPVAMSEKERTLQSKMEALRKSREERAQKQAAKNNPKSPTEASEIKASDQSQFQLAASIPGLKPLSIPSEPVKAQVQSASSNSISSLSVVQAPAPAAAAPPPATVIPGLFLASTVASPTPATTVQSTPVPVPMGIQRKRPIASDFDTPLTSTPFKRPFGQSRNERPLVIDVSDEDVDSEDEDVEMDLESQADQESPMQTARTMSDHRLMAIQNLPQLSDFQPRKPFTPPPNSSAATTPPVLQGTSKATLGRPEILQRKESEIEILKKKIAEAEAKKRARQTPTGTQTPRTAPEISSVETKVGLNNGTLASKIEVSKKIQELVGVVNNQTNKAQQKFLEAHAAEEDEATALKRNEDERKRLRRQKIASELPLVDAKVQETQARLDQMRAETARLEAEYFSNVEAKRIMAEEMERLGEEAEDELQEVKNKLQDLTNDESSNNDVILNPPVVAIPDEITNSSPAAAAQTPVHEPQPTRLQPHEAEVADVKMSEDSSPHAPVQSDVQATSNVAMEAPTNLPQPLDTVSQGGFHEGKDRTSDDRALEAALQEAVRAEADSHTQEDVDMEASFAPNSNQLAPAPSSNLANEEPQSPDYSPVLHRIASDNNDAESDTYEPPEATPPIDAPAPVESPPFSPAPPNNLSEPAGFERPLQVIDNQAEDREVLPEQSGTTEQVPQHGIVEAARVQLFTPYKSPLKQFHAYRFHPNYEQEVPGGLRSLTYSHKIQADKEFCRYELAGGVCNDKTCESQHFSDIKILDDGILSTLGSPDQFTGTQREEYCSGLRGVLQDLRARKIRAFDVIAPEIVAFRSKFLGDPSKILNLEGATL
ncbi:hypothetical protein BGZ60DRAFT_570702 [Tricladium varicosporioides]|nr:hypothetical protein BGZ60DRAFT_570702 [Hymenoscyphus varicosporioides]